MFFHNLLLFFNNKITKFFNQGARDRSESKLLVTLKYTLFCIYFFFFFFFFFFFSEELQQEMETVYTNCVELNEKFEEKKAKALEMKQSTNQDNFSTSAWGDDTWGDSTTAEVDVDSWPVDTAAPTTQAKEEDTSGVKKYRALYEFVARNQDEISFQPGDIIIVSLLINYL